MTENKSARVLIVEDEPDIAALVTYQLARSGMQVSAVSSGREALQALDAEVPDLLVLDLMLPEIGGLEVLRTLRSRPKTRELPVLILTARREQEDRINGLELGADDYLPKPFSQRELVLRVRALLRRAGATAGGQQKRLRAGALVVDTGSNQVTVDGKEIQLTPIEFRLLVCLLERKGRTQSRRTLLEAVWDTTADIETRTVDMHVRRLRAKLGSAAGAIETVRGFGYRFKPED